MKTLAEKVWPKVDRRGDDECWPWLGAHNRFGRGHLQVGGRGTPFTTAPRAVWTVCYGEPPKGIEVCHTCDHPPCCNPSHLFLGTRQDNMADMAQKGRSGGQKLTADQVEEIRRRYAVECPTFSSLGREYGVSRVQIRNIVSMKHHRLLGHDPKGDA